MNTRPTTRSTSSNAHSDQHKTDDAINEYHNAIDLDPRFALAHCNLGNALRKRHNNGHTDERTSSLTRRSLSTARRSNSIHMTRLLTEI
ncbi:MAG: hypothetical protein CR217_07070 [Beijerinckiaceae bacterium]|nr:MAG: hypothetical protein CR217_07070 [Beijerinckiaceae bacterium]